jgi:Family of unknown function (DUF6169)
LSKIYDLTSTDNGGFQFTNNAGDFYFVYLTKYSLLHPFEDDYMDAFMLGFSCKRNSPLNRHHYDAKTKATIISIFKKYMNEHPRDAFLYICDNSDGLERNRRVIFGNWFNETSSNFELHYSHIKYNSDNWYSALLVGKDNPEKELFIRAFHFTLAQILDNTRG